MWQYICFFFCISSGVLVIPSINMVDKHSIWCLLVQQRGDNEVMIIYLRASAHKRHINDIFVAGSSSSWALTAKYRCVVVCGVAGWGTTTFCRSCSPSCSIVATCSTIAVGGFGSVALLLLLQIALLYKSVNLSFACETNFICEIVWTQTYSGQHGQKWT